MMGGSRQGKGAAAAASASTSSAINQNLSLFALRVRTNRYKGKLSAVSRQRQQRSAHGAAPIDRNSDGQSAIGNMLGSSSARSRGCSAGCALLITAVIYAARRVCWACSYGRPSLFLARLCASCLQAPRLLPSTPLPDELAHRLCRPSRAPAMIAAARRRRRGGDSVAAAERCALAARRPPYRLASAYRHSMRGRCGGNRRSARSCGTSCDRSARRCAALRWRVARPPPQEAARPPRHMRGLQRRAPGRLAAPRRPSQIGNFAR